MRAPLKKQKTRIEDIRRLELIEAAHRLFLREGLNGMTSTKICAEAGMSQGILTYYFRNKDEVLFEMVRMNTRILTDNVVARLKAARSDWERIIALIDGSFPAANSDWSTARAWVSLYAEATHNERYARLIRPYYRRLRSNFGPILRQHLSPQAIDQFVSGFAAMIDGLWLRRGISESDTRVDDAKRLLVCYAEQTLGPDLVARLRA